LAGVASTNAIHTTSNHAILHQAVRLNAKNFHLFSPHSGKPDKQENTENWNMVVFGDAIMKRKTYGHKQTVCHHFMRLPSRNQYQ
jgi:hypothetical protein